MAGRWRVTLLLPAGEWNVLPEEDQPIELVPGTPRATLRWTVTPERWSRQDKLFRFQLRGATGGVFRMSVVYPPTINAPNRFLLEVLGQALASIHG
jgi:hypothetical protein